MFETLSLAAAAVALAVQSAPVSDPRSADAVAVFGDLCVGLFTGKQADPDPKRFKVTKISEATARKIKPGLKGQTLWDVSGTKSDVHMLVHYEPAGLCVVEIAEADEGSTRAQFERLVLQTSADLGSAAQRQADERKTIDDKHATTSAWRMKSPKGDIMLVVTTYPDPKFMIQHLMTVSYVR